MSNKTALLWLRQDLRLHDNPALIHAAENGFSIIPVYILDDENAGDWRMGGASRWWLHRALEDLNASMDNAIGFYKGDAASILPALVRETGAQAVFWSRCYEPWRIARDKKIKEMLSADGTEVKSFNASLLWEPWEIKKGDGTPYKVFTPYYRNGCLHSTPPAFPEAPPASPQWTRPPPSSLMLKDLSLLPAIDWHTEMEKLWQPGESGARAQLDTFLKNGLKGYKTERNRPDLENISRLSPYLHFGNISPRTVWHAVRASGQAQNLEADTDTYCSELGWREFSYYLLYHFPALPEQPFQEKFSRFAWQDDPDMLRRWQKGQTGIPIVDAGMRQLWRTGWMHNRVRMIVASLLVKNMLIHWRRGEDWFWDTLVDADLASNAASWQWVAGSGADAAPYFRIFNPVTQGQKFDPNGDYVRDYVPELKGLPAQWIHTPWDAPPMVLAQAGIKLGNTYPLPAVDLSRTRNRALEAYQDIRNYGSGVPD